MKLDPRSADAPQNRRLRGATPAAGILGLLLALAPMLAPAPADAQSLSTFQVTLSTGVGGAFDAEPDTDLDGTNLQLSVSMLTQARSLLTARVGSLELDGDLGFGTYAEADMTYLTIAGEYRSRGSYFDSGLFLGLGGYFVDGTRFGGLSDDEVKIGLTGGVTAEFPIHRRLSLHSELAAHFADFEDAQFFGTLNVGVTYRF